MKKKYRNLSLFLILATTITILFYFSIEKASFIDN